MESETSEKDVEIEKFANSSFDSYKNPIRSDEIEVQQDTKCQDTTCQELSIGPYSCLTEHELMSKFYPCINIDKKRQYILQNLTTDGNILDLKISLYIAACNGGFLKPFPDQVVEDSYDGLQSLLLLNSQIPPVPLLKQFLEDNIDINEHVINLVHWILALPGPKYVNVNPQEIPNILNKVSTTYGLYPDYIFRAMVNKSSQNQLFWIATKENLMQGQAELETKFAFYSASVEHLHSLTNLGLWAFQKTEGPRGYGLYLMDNLQLCLEHSPSKWVWGKSSYGIQLQTAVIVEFILNHPNVTSYIDDSTNTKFYFIENTHLVQFRYILMYAKTISKIRPEICPTVIPRDEISRSIISLNRAFMITGCIVASYYILKTHKIDLFGFSSLLQGLKTIKFFNTQTQYVQL